MKEVLDDEQDIKYSDMGDIIWGFVFDIFRKREIKEEVLQFLIFSVDEVERDDKSINNDDNNLHEKSNHHILRKLIDSQDLIKGFSIIFRLQFHHIVEEENVQDNN